jgi:D-xylose transport system ATP-binding protein
MHMSSALLEMSRIGKEFPGTIALEGVTFDLHAGEIHALVGENGAGKSTLMKILGGVYPHGNFSGEIRIDGSRVRFRSVAEAEHAGIAVIHQELNLVPSLSVAENIFLGAEPVNRGKIDTGRMILESRQVLGSLGFELDPETEVSRLGIGQQQLVEIARALQRRRRILVLDEPTAALEGKEVEVLLGLVRRLAESGTGLVYISHKLDEVFALAHRISVLRDGKLVASRAGGEWSREQVISAMVGRELSTMFPVSSVDVGAVVLEIRGLLVRKISGDRVGPMSFNVRSGEVVGLAGLMGAGRSEILQSIFGGGLNVEGELLVDGSKVGIHSPRDAVECGIALVPEDRKRQGLVGILGAFENLSLAHLADFCHAGVINRIREEGRCREQVGDLQVVGAEGNPSVDTLSGGNQQKIVLGKWLLRKPTVLLLDEPTRGIDVGAKAEVYQLIARLKQEGLAIVLASSELPELLGLCDRILVIRRGIMSGELHRQEASQQRIMELAV